MDILQQIPDNLKVSASVAPVVLEIAGIPVEQWMFVLSGIVSILFIIEKMPMLIRRINEFREWIYARRKKQRKD